MATYGYDFYGVGKYGTTSLIEFDARPFEALSIDYDRLLLAWRSPAGDWDRLRLTRDSNGYAPRYDMGLVLIDTASSGAPTTHLDQSNITPGQFYYYTVWVRNTSDGVWRRAADTTGLAVHNWRNSERLYELIPSFYRDKDFDTASARIYGKGPLERYLEIFGYQLDHIRTEYETLKDTNNADKVAGGLLPLLTKQWGFGFESELGMRLARIQARNAVHLYKLKGTRLGVEGFVSAMTGWAPTVTAGVNLMLDQNDSSMAESIGRWRNTVVASPTVTIERVTVTSTGTSQAVPVPSGSSTGDIGSGPGILRLTAITAGTIEVQNRASIDTNAANRMSLIPVTPGRRITLSGYVRAVTTRRDARVMLTFFTAAGDNLAGPEWGAAVSEQPAAWERVTSSSIAPATAAFVMASLRIEGAAAGEQHYVQAVQVEETATAVPTAFQSARSIRVKLAAERINLNPNGSLEVNANGWGVSTATGTGYNAVRDTTLAYSGSASFRADLPANVGLGIFAGTAYDAVPAVAGRTYTVSIYLRPTIATTANIEVAFWRVPMGGGAAADTIGPNIALPANTWTRVSRTVVAPAGNNTMEFRVNLLANAVAHSVYMDAALIEEGAALQEYFDGAVYSPEGEYIWQGTPGGSATHYYSRRLIKNFRLNQRLNEFLPSGSTYALIYATP